jgi:peptide-methionine (S)-S-oxide reductase
LEIDTSYVAGDFSHQQYLDRNKNGYCGIGVSCPIGVAMFTEE